MEPSRSPRNRATMSHAVRSLVSALTILSMLSPSLSLAAERFWVGNYGSNTWDDTKNWSATLGGGGGASIPGASDTAMIVKNNSGNTINLGKTTTVGGIVLSPSFTGALRTGTSTFILGGTGMKIGSGYFIIGTGSVLASSGTILQTGGVVYNVRANHRLRLSGGLIIVRRARFRYSGTIVFNGNADQTLAFSGSMTEAAPATIAVGRYRFSGMILDKAGGTTVDDLVVSGATLRMRSLVINKGNFSLAGATSANTEGRRPAVVAAISGSVTVANDANAMFSTNANVTLSGSISTSANSTFVMSGGTLLLNGVSDQTIDLPGQRLNNLTIDNRGGTTVDDIIMSGATLQLSGALTVTLGNLDLATWNVPMVVEQGITLADNAQATLVTGSNMTVSGSFIVNNAATLTVSGGVITLNDRGDQNVDFDGQRIWGLTINNAGGTTDDDVTMSGANLVLSGALTITLGNLDLDSWNVPLVVQQGITLADNAQATLVTESNMTVSGAILVNDAAVLTVSGGTLLLNDIGDQSVDLDGQRIYNLTLNNTGGATDDDVTIAGSGMITRAITITRGNLNLATNSQTLSASGNIAIADHAQATLSTNSNLRMSGSLTTGAAGRFSLSGGTLTMNGIRQDLDTAGLGSSIHSLTIAANSGVYLTSTNLVLSTLTINSSRILTFAANTLYLTGGTITNNGTIRENTGKLVHTGSAVKAANSDYNELAEIQGGSTLFLSVTDTDENISGTAADTITVVVSISGGDSETVTLTETTNTSGIFRGSIVTETATAVSENAKLQATVDKVVTVTYTDAQDLLVKTDTILFTPIGSSSTASTNSGGGSSRSRGGGGGGGGGGTVSKPSVTPKQTTPPPRVTPVKPTKKKMTVSERKAVRMQRLQGMLGRKNARKAARQGRSGQAMKRGRR